MFCHDNAFSRFDKVTLRFVLYFCLDVEDVDNDDDADADDNDDDDEEEEEKKQKEEKGGQVSIGGTHHYRSPHSRSNESLGLSICLWSCDH